MFNFLDPELVLRILRIIIVALIFYLFFRFIFQRIKRNFFQRAKTKKERSNVEVFFRAIQYAIIVLAVIFAFLFFGGSFAGIGLAAGLLSAALGWALQRPITGMAAWLMVVAKRPFEIGDRVIIGSVKGDVLDITLIHIHIGEIGGTISAEESSGRIILIPNAKLFEEDIINYTKEGEDILDEVKFSVTFESNIEKAKKIAKESANKVLEKFGKKIQDPYLRTWFQPNGIDVVIRYFVSAILREEVRSQITQEIYGKIQPSKDVDFAYPHTEVIFRKKS